MPFVMSQEDSADIDTLDDLERAERLLARRGS
jgi:CMP-N-acetylneuraminic acid synthetase